MTEEKKEFKRTEVGLIPEDWEIVKLGDLSDITSSKRIMKSEYQKSGVPFYRSKEIIDKSRNTYEGSEIHIPTDRYESLKRNYGAPVDGEILVSAVGTLGVTYLIKESDLPFYFKDGNLIWLRKISDKVEPNFLTFYFNSSRFEKEIDKTTAGSSQRALTIVKLKNFNIPLPPTLEEQQAIAEALSDVDELIRSLGGLIQKKQSIKKGTMQQLLTGIKRLPGFDGEWEMKKLGEVLNVCHGKSQKQVESAKGEYPILATGGQIGKASEYLYHKPSVLIGRKGTIDKPQYIDEPFWTIDTLFYTEVKKNAVPKFLYYKFLLIDWRSYNEASGVPSLNSSTIESVETKMPDDLSEQEAIVNILDDMEQELQTLRQKREKYVQIKQGMMQELLTGRVRLV